MASLPRKIRKVGAPLGVIIALGTLVGLILILITTVNPVGAAVGFVLTTIAMTVVLLCYLWLDRWEPEPPRLLVFAFLWGASVAVLLSVVLEVLTESVVNPATTRRFRFQPVYPRHRRPVDRGGGKRPVSADHDNRPTS